MKITKLSIIIAAVLVIVLSISFYGYHFRDQSLSDETSHWGAFSDYINPFVAIANLIVFIWLSIEVYNYNEKKDKQTEVFQQAIEKPILIFMSMLPSETGMSNELWIIKNIGNGAALNLRVAESQTREILWVSPVTKCYSLASGDSLKLNWLTYANAICVTYEDIFGTKYVTIGADDESHIQPINNDFKTIEITEKSFDLSEFTTFLNLPTRRLHAALKSSGTTSATMTSQTTSR